MKISGNYLHVRNDTGKIFYVGLGPESRAHTSNSRNIYWKRIVEKHGYSVQYLGDRSLEEAKALEKSLIKVLGRRDLKKGHLVNMTDGGDGVFNLAAESKARIGMSSRNHMKGRKLPKEWRDKMTEGVRKYHENNPGANAGRITTKEENEKRSASLKKYHAENPNARIERGQKSKETWADEAIRARRVEGLRKVLGTKEYKANHSAIMKKRYESESEREKTSQHSLAMWEAMTPEKKAERSMKLKKFAMRRAALAKILGLKINQVTKQVMETNKHLLED